MATVNFKGAPVPISGNLPVVGTAAPAFTLAKGDLGDLTLESLKGRKVVLNIFPSIDTSVCATSVRRFNEAAATRGDATVVCVSRDLPFAQTRFCGAEGLKAVVTASDFRNGKFGKAYGVEITAGPLAGLLCRAVVVIDAAGKVIHTELVPEITQEPDYAKALAVLG